MKPDISSYGQHPTAFEKALFRAEAEGGQIDRDDVWMLLAQRIGLEALCAVLDEIGGMGAMSAPTRGEFFGRMSRRRRREQVQRLHAGGASVTEIAAQLDVSIRTVRRDMGGVS